MPNTYTLIASNTLSSNANSVTFSSIPGSYTDLLIRMSVRDTGGGTTQPFYIWFNNEGSTTTYSTTLLTGNGSAASSTRESSTNAIRIAALNASGSTASTFSNHEIYISNYTASQNKPVSSFGVAETNATAVPLSTTAGLWRNTNAITSITLVPNQFASGSSFWLYGIKNS